MADRSDTDPLIAIRLWPRHHATDAAVDALLAEFARHPGCCDEVWFCTEVGFPALDAHRRSAARMARAAARVRAAGIAPGIQIANIIGHADMPILPEDGIAWRRLVGPDGRPARMCGCPRAGGLADYLRQMLAHYVAFGPSSVWIDDDLRMQHHHPIEHGCFCEECLAAFNERSGRAWGRPTLVAALNAPDSHELRRAWAGHNQAALADLAALVAAVVTAVSPATRMGLQHAAVEFSLYNGPDWAGVYQAMRQAGAAKLGSRPGHGVYNDHRPREMIDKAHLIARQVSRLPADVGLVCPEVENFTHTAMGKTGHGTAVESTLDLAVGCNSLSYAVLCSGHESYDWYGRHMLATLSAWRPFWQRYLDSTAGTHPGGLDVVCGRDAAGRTLRPDDRPFAWARADVGRVYQLCTLGLPLCCESPAACAAILCAEAADNLSDDELRSLLAGGAMLDGSAAERLAERGLAGLLGADVARFGPLDSHERLTDDPANGQFAGGEWWVWYASESSPIYRLAPAPGMARVLGEYVDVRGRVNGAATVLAENTLGGRTAVFAFDGFEPVVSSAKRWQMLSAADWISRGRLPVLIETPAQVMAVPRVDAADRLRAVSLLNASIGPTPPLTVRLRRPAGPRLTWVEPTRPDVALPASCSGEEAVVQSPAIGPWSVGYILAE